MADLYESLKGLISKDENVSKVFDTVKNAIDEHGLDAVLEKFRASGLDDKVQSWISKGKNAALSPDEVKGALGSRARQLRRQGGCRQGSGGRRDREGAPGARRQAHARRGRSERGKGQERAQLDRFVARSKAVCAGGRNLALRRLSPRTLQGTRAGHRCGTSHPPATPLHDSAPRRARRGRARRR